MMMFSLSPISSSLAPRIAASVRTRVVSWKRRRRDERLRRETGLGDSEKQRLRRRRRFLLLLRLLVGVAEGLLVDVLALEELGLAGLEHAHLLQHLPDDHANVLVVDLHALQAVNLLHFVEQILLNRARSLDAENVVRIHRTFGETVSRSHAVALVHAQGACRPPTSYSCPRDLVGVRPACPSARRRSRACRA